MKRYPACLFLLPLFLLLVTRVEAGHLDVDVRLNLVPAVRPLPVRDIMRPLPPVYRPAPATYVQPAGFVYLDGIGLYIATGIPEDLCYLDGRYYWYRDGLWLRGGDRDGRWLTLREWELPPVLRHYRIERLRAERDWRHEERRRHEGWYRGEGRRHDRDDDRRDSDREDRHGGNREGRGEGAERFRR